MKLIKIVTLILFTGVFASLNAQNGVTGSWKVHLPFQTASTLTADNQRIYVETDQAAFLPMALTTENWNCGTKAEDWRPFR